MGIENYLIEAAARFPEKAAIIQRDRRSTYSELLTGAQHLARWLNQSVPGNEQSHEIIARSGKSRIDFNIPLQAPDGLI